MGKKVVFFSIIGIFYFNSLIWFFLLFYRYNIKEDDVNMVNKCLKCFCFMF